VCAARLPSRLKHAIGSRCIAAPVFDETGDRIAAVSASGPMARIVEERVAQLGAQWGPAR